MEINYDDDDDDDWLQAGRPRGRSSRPGRCVKLTTHLQLVLRSRKYEYPIRLRGVAKI
jgi:hypothetical protein